MNFLSPLFLIGAAAAAVPILLHLLKRQPEARVKFAAIRLLRNAPVEHMQRRRLRELLLLALRVTALVLLALAFARPFLASGRADQPAGVTIVALDTSLSLSAAGQFERAKTLAKEVIAAAPAGDLVGVVTFSNEARVAREPSGDRALAVAAVDQAATNFGATRYRAALSRASAAIEGRRGTIVVVTDLQEGGWDAGDSATVFASTEVKVVDIGAPPPNLAVISVRAAGERVAAVIRNAGPSAREARVRLTVDGRIAGEATAAMAPGQSSEVMLPGARGTEASVAVDDPSGIQADNVRYLVLNNRIRPVVLLLTAASDPSRDAFYVRHALAAEGADGAAYDVESPGNSALAAWDGPRLARYAAIVVMSTRGLERHGRQLLTEYVRQGGGLLLALGPDVDADVAAELTGGAIALDPPPPGRDGPSSRAFAPIDARHPVFQAFGIGRSSLGLVTFSRIALLRAPRCETLARFTSGENALRRMRGNRGADPRLRLRLEQRLERLPAASDLRAVSARNTPIPGRGASERRRVPRRRRTGWCRGQTRHRRDSRDRRSARPPGFGQRRSARIHARAADGGGISRCRHAAAGHRPGGKPAGGSPARGAPASLAMGPWGHARPAAD